MSMDEIFHNLKWDSRHWFIMFTFIRVMLLFVWLSIVTLTTRGSPSMTQDFSRHISKLTRPRAKRSGRLTEAAGGIHTADLSAEPGIWITFTSKLIELLHIQINRRMRIGTFKGLNFESLWLPFMDLRFSNSWTKTKHFNMVTDSARFASQMRRLEDVHWRANRSWPIQMERKAIFTVFCN